MFDEQIASVSIGCGLDLSGIQRDLKAIDRMTQQVTMAIGVQINTRQVYSQIDWLAQSVSKTVIRPKVDHKPFHELNAHIKLKDKDIKGLQKTFDQTTIRPRVDRQPFQQLSKDVATANPELKRLEQQIKKLQSIGSTAIKVESSGTSSGRSAASNTTRLENLASQQLSASRESVRALKEINQSVKQSRGGPLGNIFAGAAQAVGFQISGAVQASLRRNFGVDIKKTVGKAADAASVPIKVFVTENSELQATLKKTSDAFGDRMRQAGYKVGDGIVAALEENESGIIGRINAFTKAVVGDSDIKQSFQEIRKEAQATAKEVGQAFVRSPNLKPYIDQFGDRLSAYRQVALQERAIPLVQQRAAEILNQKRAKNSAQLVTDETEQFIISTGGYAGARGLSGQRIAAELGKQFGENVVSVWVRNLDTDLPKESMGVASKKLQALLTSLAKPNIRGYSKDAVEIAAQALAALEKNPDLKVKILGESGGGFPAEEAAQILNMMGAGDRIEYLGVGTPDFTGRLKGARGQKIISPDERLGAEVQGVYARYGFADASYAGQNILGVEGHPYEHYRDAGVAELQNFLQGAPQSFSEEELSQVKRAAQAFDMTDPRSMGSRELEDFAKKAYANLQLVRRQLLAATDDTRDELQEVADTFQRVYVRLAPEPGEFAQVRQVVDQANALYQQLDKERGVGAGQTAAIALKELKQYQKEFNQKYKGAVGTIGLKAQEISGQLEQLVTAFDDPSLSIKPRTPVVQPEVTFDGPRGGQLDEVEPVQKSIVRRMVDRGVDLVVRKVQSDIETVREGVIDLVVNRINDQLMRVPNRPDLLDPSRQIGVLDELTPGDAFKLARIGTEDTLRGVGGATAKGMAILQGVENVALEALPGGKTGKAIGRHLVLPTAIGVGGMLAPHVGGAVVGAESMIADALGTALGAPGGAALDFFGNQISSATVNAVDAVINVRTGNIVFDQLAHGLGASARWGINAIGGQAGNATLNALKFANQGVADMIGWGVTPWFTGKAAMNLLEGGAKAALPALPEAQVKENLLLQEATKQQLKVLQKGVETVKALMPVNPERAQIYASGIKRDNPQIAARLDEALGALPPAQRMSAGQELAALKGQLVKAQQDLARAEQRASKLGQFVQGIAEMMGNPMDAIQKSVKGVEDILEAEVISVEPIREIKALPDARANLQKQFDAIVGSASTQIAQLGEEFSSQAATLKRANLDPTIKAEVAAAIDSSVDEARKAIEEIISTFGGRVPEEVKKAARSTRQRITKADQSAQGSLVAAKQAGIAIPDGFNEGVESRIAALKQTGETLADAVIVAAENKLEIRSPSRVFKRIGEMVVQGFQAGMNQANKVAQSAQTLVNGAVGGATSGANQASNRFTDLLQAAKSLAIGFVGFKAAEFLIPFLQNAAGAALETANEFDRFERTLSFALGSASEASDVLDNLQSSSQDLGFNFRSAAEGYASFANAVRDTPYEGLTEQATRAINQAASVSGYNAEQTERAYRFVSQIAQKGVVSQEEVRQQAGEIGGVLGQTTGIAARGMGTTTQALNARIDRGEVTSQEFLNAFLPQLIAETSSGVAGASTSPQAAINRLDNSLTQLKASFGEVLQPAQVALFNNAASALQLVGDNVGTLVQAFSAAGIAIASGFLPPIALSRQALLGFAGQATKLPGALMSIAPAAKAASLAIGTMLAKTALVYAAFEVFKLGSELFSDASGGLSDFADDSTRSLEKLRSELEKTGEVARKNADDLRALGDIGEFRDAVRNDPFMGQDSAFAEANRRNAERLRSIPVVGGALASGFEFINTPIPEMLNNQQVDRQTKAFREETDKILANTQEIVNQTDQFIAGSTSQAIDQINTLDQQLSKVQSQLRVLRAEDPTNTDAIKKAAAEESRLLSAREQSTGELAKIQQAQQSQLDSINGALETYDKLLKANAISQDDYNKATKELKQNLVTVESQQARLNDAIGDSASELGKVAKELDKIAARLQDAKDAIEFSTNLGRINIARQQIAGNLTTGQAQFATDQQNIQALNQQIKINQAEIQNLRNQLSTGPLSTALTSLGLNADSVIGTAEAERRQKGYQESDPEFKSLDILSQASQLKRENASLQAQAEEAQAQTVESLRSANKEVLEFMRSIQQQTEDMQAEIDRMQVDTKFQKIKTEFSRNLSAFDDVFFGSLWDTLNELFDIANQRAQLINEKAQKEREIQRQQLSNQQQQQNLQSNLYSGGQAFSGVDIINPDGSVVQSAADLQPHHDYHQTALGNVYDFSLLDPSTGSTAVGVPSPIAGTVEVSNDPSGYGLSVDIVSSAGTRVKLAHFDSLNVTQGQQIDLGEMLGIQGSSGVSSGPHVHIEAPQSIIDQYIPMLDQGYTPAAAATTTQPITGGVDIVALRRAIMGQESGGNATIQNPDTGAAGLYQIMPENIGPWAEMTVGRWVGLEEFLSNPDLQTQIANGMMKNMLETALQNSGGNLELAIRMVGAEWYSGQQSLYDDPTPQYSNGQEYPSIQQYGLEVLDRYRQEAGKTGTQPGGVTAPNYGPQIDSTMGANAQTAQQLLSTSDQQLQAQDANLALEAEQLRQKAVRQVQTSYEDLNQSVTEERRKQEELLLQSIQDTPAGQILSQLRADTQRVEDGTREQRQLLEQVNTSYANVESRLEFYEKYPTAPGFEIVPKLQELLPKLAEERQKLEDVINKQDEANNRARASIIAERTRQIQEEKRAIEQETRSLQAQLNVARMGDNPLVQQLTESRNNTNQIIESYVNEMNGFLAEADRLQSQIEEYAKQGIELRPDELASMEAEIQHLKEQAAAAELQGTLKIEIEVENRQRVIDEFARDIESRMNDAGVQSLQRRGDVFGANELQYNAGLIDIREQYAKDQASIDYLEAQGEATPAQISQMRSDLESLNQFNMENLRMQFPDLADTINSTAFGAVQNLGNSLVDVFANAKSGKDILNGLGQAFQQFAGQVISSLLQMAAQAAISDLFGLFFPERRGGGMGGGLGSLFTTLSDTGLNSAASLSSSGMNAGAGFSGSGGGGFDAGSAIGLISTFAGFFADGGYVPGVYRGRPDELDAKLTQGEYVLNRETTAAIGKTRLDSWNFGNVPRFATGGYVDYAAATPRRNYRDYSAESESRSAASAPSKGDTIKHEYEVTKIDEKRYVSEETFRKGLAETSSKTEERIRKGIKGNPSYRQNLGIR